MDGAPPADVLAAEAVSRRPELIALELDRRADRRVAGGGPQRPAAGIRRRGRSSARTWGNCPPPARRTSSRSNMDTAITFSVPAPAPQGPREEPPAGGEAGDVERQERGSRRTRWAWRCGWRWPRWTPARDQIEQAQISVELAEQLVVAEQDFVDLGRAGPVAAELPGERPPRGPPRTSSPPGSRSGWPPRTSRSPPPPRPRLPGRRTLAESPAAASAGHAARPPCPSRCRSGVRSDAQKEPRPRGRGSCGFVSGLGGPSPRRSTRRGLAALWATGPAYSSPSTVTVSVGVVVAVVQFLAQPASEETNRELRPSASPSCGSAARVNVSSAPRRGTA